MFPLLSSCKIEYEAHLSHLKAENFSEKSFHTDMVMYTPLTSLSPAQLLPCSWHLSPATVPPDERRSRGHLVLQLWWDDLTCPAICHRESKPPTHVCEVNRWRARDGFSPSGRGRACLPSQSKLPKGLLTVQTHFPEILTLHKPQAEAQVPCLATSKQGTLTGEPRFLSSIQWPCLISCSTDEEVMLVCVPKCLGHCLTYVRNPTSICGRKEDRKGGKKRKREQGRRQKWIRPFRKLGTQQKFPYANIPVFWGMEEVCNMSFTEGDWVPCGNMDNGTFPWFGYTVVPPDTPDVKGWIPMADTLHCLSSIHSCFFLN